MGTVVRLESTVEVEGANAVEFVHGDTEPDVRSMRLLRSGFTPYVFPIAAELGLQVLPTP